MENFRRSVRAGDIACKYHPDAYILTIQRAGDMVCEECGLVVSERIIDEGAEWRSFADDEGSRDVSRCGPQDSGHTVMVGPSDFGGSSSPLFLMGKRDNKRGMFSSAYKALRALAERLNVSSGTIDRAYNLYQKVHEVCPLKNRPVEAKAAAALYVACRQEGVPRSFTEICSSTDAARRDVGRCFKIILKALNENVTAVTPMDFMDRFCAKLELPNKIRRAAIYAANKIAEHELAAGKTPITIAATIIFMVLQASPQKRTQTEISDACGVAISTISAAYEKLLPSVGMLLPDDFENGDQPAEKV